MRAFSMMGKTVAFVVNTELMVLQGNYIISGGDFARVAPASKTILGKRLQ